ncbi:unnamed protein product [Arctogadus glacialis]
MTYFGIGQVRISTVLKWHFNMGSPQCNHYSTRRGTGLNYCWTSRNTVFMSALAQRAAERGWLVTAGDVQQQKTPGSAVGAQWGHPGPQPAVSVNITHLDSPGYGPLGPAHSYTARFRSQPSDAAWCVESNPITKGRQWSVVDLQ